FGSVPFINLAALTLFAAFDNLLLAAVILSAFLLLIGVAMLSDAARATRNLCLAFSKLNSAEIQKTDEITADSSLNSDLSEPFVSAPDIVATKTASNKSHKARKTLNAPRF
ncbi:MAG: hypothetical protein M3Q33_02420, partial [Acidobacteriota bacterium]|nr:hypothetical protein [Acidobacteriota bacterium]